MSMTDKAFYMRDWFLVTIFVLSIIAACLYCLFVLPIYLVERSDDQREIQQL